MKKFINYTLKATLMQNLYFINQSNRENGKYFSVHHFLDKNEQSSVECTSNCSNGAAELHLASQIGSFQKNHQEIVQLS